MSVLGLTACSDDAEMTDSRVTYYVNLDMQGEEFVQVPIGTPYTDAGCTATENGEDVTSKIVVDGLIDIDVNQQQKALMLGAQAYDRVDYGEFLLIGYPKAGQTLQLPEAPGGGFAISLIAQ